MWGYCYFPFFFSLSSNRELEFTHLEKWGVGFWTPVSAFNMQYSYWAKLTEIFSISFISEWKGTYLTNIFFLLWWLGFEPWTLHILCIVHTNWAMLTRTYLPKLKWVFLYLPNIKILIRACQWNWKAQ